MRLKINNKIYNVKVVTTDEEMEKGLRGVENLPDNEGMWFEFEKPQSVDFEMDETLIDLLIVFIDENLKVISTEEGKAGDTEDFLSEDNVKYVLEVNPTDNIKPGDKIEILDSTIHILDENGKKIYAMQGGERVFSRPNTQRLLELARIANNSKSDEDYLKLGKTIKKYIEIQNERPSEYVEK
jgi:uncharacterized membrane protein (UPF0127 family)